jgi:Leucine-rich repeat (LRR) protein
MSKLDEILKSTEIVYELNLSYLDLISIPPEFGNLTKLRKLWLTDNQLTSLPSEIGRLTKLTELNLCYNQLTSLPIEIVYLTNLTKLWLNNNQLTKEEQKKIKKLLPNCEIMF